MSNQQAIDNVQRERKYLSINEAAQEYGNSPGFWRKRVFLKQIPYVKAGRSVKIRREDLEGWHAARRVVPATGAVKFEEGR